MQWRNIIDQISSFAPAGDFVECGTGYGVSAAVLSKNCKQTLHAFDSWEGIPDISEFDGEYYKKQKWICDFDQAQKYLSSFNNIKYYKGWFPDRFNEVDKEISLLHIDASIYTSTKMSLEYFWPRLMVGGHLIVNFHDDISIGAKKAVYEMFNENDLQKHEYGIHLIIK